MAFSHGKKQVFWLDNSAGSLANLTAYFEDIAFPRVIETATVNTLGDDNRERIVGVADGNFSGSGKWDPALDAHIAGVMTALLSGSIASVTYEYGPAGSASGAVKYTGECIVNEFEVSGGTGDAQGFSFGAELTGAVTRTTWS